MFIWWILKLWNNDGLFFLFIIASTEGCQSLSKCFKILSQLEKIYWWIRKLDNQEGRITRTPLRPLIYVELLFRCNQSQLYTQRTQVAHGFPEKIPKKEAVTQNSFSSLQHLQACHLTSFQV